MVMKTITEQKTRHRRMMMREEVKLISQGRLMLLIVMLNREWWKNLVIWK